MAHAISVAKYGGPEVLEYKDVAVGEPGPGQVKMTQTAIGVNFIDVYHRTGLYQQPSMPFIPGSEGAGTVTALGAGVTTLKVGDRVAYAGSGGGYSTERLMAADRVVKIPDGVDDKTAAAMMLQGMTVRYLLRRTYKVGPGTTLLWHAAAGGVGQIACQWAKHLGATIIATAGGPEKCAIAKAAGATHVIDYKTENFVARVKEITGGKMCDVVYDSIGKDTFPASLDCLKPLGLFVSFGNASGPIDAFNLGILAAKGSLYVTRPSLAAYTSTRADLEETANDLFDVVKKGIVKINIFKAYPLKDAAQVHRDLEGRKTTGSIVMVP
ncbi:MAG: quinone oxidoreductase [Hyphomicrobiaceae bacterium]|nr:quinone oxidoreductase [Hyphomicrobiaceae bacterium]